jgi:DNA primase
MSYISKSTIQEVNDRLDPVSTVQNYVRLERKSGRWWGRCPFHAGGQERTPSFKVDPDYKTYHCFGCGKGGSVISFVMEMDKLTYPEAIKMLAKSMGIEIVYEDGMPEDTERNTRVEELLELYGRTAKTFQHFLHKSPEGSQALRYIAERGISEEMTQSFQLGYAPADRNFLYGFLSKKGYSQDFLDKCGLFSSRHRGFPLFSGRLMFPISDRQGRVVAFGGRILPETETTDSPKYINSPELETFKKGQTLFAIDIAVPYIRQEKAVYLAEGYMDVIALHQAGVKNSVAPLGTSFTDEQAKLLKRWAEKAILVLDSDDAGRKAALKAILTCRKNGLSCEVFKSNEQNSEVSKDPAEILQKFGPEILNNLIKSTIIDFEYYLSSGRSLFDVTKPEGKKGALSLLFPYLESLDSEILRDDCIAAAADAFGVEKAAIQEDYKKFSAGSRPAPSVRQAEDKPEQPITMNSELFLLLVVAVNPELFVEFRKALEIREIEDAFAKELFVALEECYAHDEGSLDDIIARIGSGALRDFIAGRGTSPEFKGSSSGDPKRLMEDGIKGIKKKRLYQRLSEITALLRQAERTGLLDNAEELISEKMDIDSQLRKLEGR